MASQLNRRQPKNRGTMRTSLHLTLGALGVAAFNVSAQTSGSPEIQLCAGLTIIGEIEKIYSIEYVTDLTDPAESDWRCLEYLQLPASPYLWADKSAPATGKRFYRAVAMEAPTNMVFIPPGTFRMGSPTNEVDRYDCGRSADGRDHQPWVLDGEV